MSQLLIQGIGNEVFFVFATFVITFIIGILITYKYGYFSQYSHHSLPESTSIDSAPPIRRIYHNENCPICLAPPRLPVETNCGHVFCGLCLKQYIENRGPEAVLLLTGPLPCPMCRQRVNLLLPSFHPDDDHPDRADIEETIRRFNVRFGNEPRSLWSYIRDCPVLLRHMIFAPEGLHRLQRLRITVCLIVFTLYFVIPIDLIPEAFLGFFGLFDDLMVLILCVVYLSTIYRGYVLRGNDPGDD